jgi:hypothetical protein
MTVRPADYAGDGPSKPIREFIDSFPEKITNHHLLRPFWERAAGWLFRMVMKVVPDYRVSPARLLPTL